MATQQLNALKTINNIQRDGSLQDLLLSIKQSKVDIDNFSKSVQEQKSKLQAKAREAEKELAKQKQEAKVEPAEKKEETTASVKEEKTEAPKKEVFGQGGNQNNNFRKFDDHSSNNRNQNKTNQGPFRQNGQGQAFGNKFQQRNGGNFNANRPNGQFNRVGKNQNGQNRQKNRPFQNS